ncbi:glycosyltransferase [Sphaerisporangium rubeum]|uniref:Glycosyltransferase involved in cell wall biosynthesis n=1 Tax=Sphaerisporangium rubeum TaxID=321317 RepID=A0A7X0ICZ1_9ACTN|nr:glycosyltransferase involved in cell wall biosynthesis [Sphaerisporangium rubeum]
MAARQHPAGLRRVVLLMSELELGGTEKQVFLLANGLHDSGVEVVVLLLTGGGPYEERLRAAGIDVRRLGFARDPASLPALWRNTWAFARLVRELRAIRPDVLHAFLFRSYMIGPPAARLAAVPVVVAGRRNQSDYKRGRRWVFTVERAATLITDHIVANAVAVLEDARTVERVPAHKLSVIYNGLPGEVFDAVTPAEIHADHPVLVCVANFKRQKGHTYLLRAAAELARRGRPCTLVLVGDGPDRPALEARAKALGLDVRFLGRRADHERMLARADVVVLSSLFEGMSNAVMEAMALGRPIVATAVGGTPELLDGRGVLVPAADPRALADGIAHVLENPAPAAALGAEARDWARKNLDVGRMVDEHVHLYRRLLED